MTIRTEAAPDPASIDPRAVIERIALAAEPFQFRTFVVGFERPGGYARDEHEARFRALKIAVGDALLSLWPGRDVDFERPEVRFDIRESAEVDLQVGPLFIAGRYRKLSRSIPATRWIHHRCHGRGCPDCSHTGNLCGPSVEELVGGPLLEATGGEATLFHGLGREDTDVRMLGPGRPFVIEVTRPRRRAIDLEAAGARIAEGCAGLAEIGRLFAVDREAARAVKAAASDKTYRALVESPSLLPEGAAALAEGLAGLTVRQLSPRRVAARRGRDTLRTRVIRESRWLGPFEGGYLWEVRVEAGTYVKELVSGDGGRTEPSLSGAFGVACCSRALDVLEVHWEPPWESGARAITRGC